MKLGSLFDGSGGFPLAGALCGIEPVWASEVEPYPIAVTKEHFSNIKHLGDVTKVNGASLEPVDIITFGSPCQDLSVAGRRAGLKHDDKGDDETTRSGLFMEAVRIIKEMREATNGECPRFAVWENVPGAFTSNKGEDFRTVCEELIKIVEPSASMPAVPKNGWNYSDSYVGDGWSLAYRIFDAQYWGVPQRRRRVYLVADFRGESARKILFERDSLRGHIETGGAPRKTTAGNFEECANPNDCSCKSVFAANLHNQSVTGEVTKPLTSSAHDCDNTPVVVHGFPLGFRPENVRCYKDVATTLCNGTRAGFCNGVIIENHPQDSRVTLNEQGIVQTLARQMGTGGGNVPMVLEPVCKMKNCKINDSDDLPQDLSYGLDRASYNQGKNAQYDFSVLAEQQPTMVAKGPGAVCSGHVVRRLTPTECARLQGFPDRWGDITQQESLSNEEYLFWKGVRNTYAEISGKEQKNYTPEQMTRWRNALKSDAAEYKMWGNGIALPCALYVMQGVIDAGAEGG